MAWQRSKQGITREQIWQRCAQLWNEGEREWHQCSKQQKRQRKQIALEELKKEAAEAEQKKRKKRSVLCVNPDGWFVKIQNPQDTEHPEPAPAECMAGNTSAFCDYAKDN